MNILFAWVLFAVVFMVGLPTVVDQQSASDDAVLTITHVVKDGPADLALLPIGAEIISLSAGENELTALTPASFSNFIQRHSESAVIISFLSGGESQEISIDPQIGIIPDSPERAAVGVALSLVEVIQKPIHIALYDASIMTVQSLGAITVVSPPLL